MPDKLKTGIMLTAFASISFLAIQYFNHKDTSNLASKTNTNTNNANFTHEAASPISPPPSSKVETNNLMETYKRTRSGRTFLLYAMQHVNQGGAYYADRLLSLCSETIHSRDWLVQFEKEFGHESNGITAEKRRRAFQSLHDRCGDILPDEYNTFKARIRAENERGNDPLLKIRSTFLAARQSKSVTEAHQAVTMLKMNPDPLIIDELGPWIASALKAEMHTAGIDSEQIANNPKVLAALSLLPCQLGLDCSDDQDFTLIMTCISGADCADSRNKYVLQNMLGGQQADFASALASARKLANVLLRH